MSKIARVKFIRDKEPNIKALTAKNKVLDGALYVATDTGTLWMGISSSSLIQIKDNINTNTTYNLTKSGNTITLSGSDGSTFNVTDSNTVYGNATASAAGLMSAADKAKLDGVAAGSNHVTVDAELSTTSTNPVQNKVIKSALDGKSNTGHTHDDRYYTETEINTKLNGKSNTGHKHVKADITDFPTSMPASDVSAWAKAATKPSYSKAEVGLGNVDNTADSTKKVKYAASAGSADSATTAATANALKVTELTTQNLDDTKTVGLYFAGGGNSVKNKPTGIDAFGLEVKKTATGYLVQVLTEGNANPMKTWIRQFNASAWSAWAHYFDSNHTPTWSQVSGKPSFATVATSGSYNDLSNKPTIPTIPGSLKNPNALTISLNGTSQGAYDGSAAKSINITASSVGAAASTHTHKMTDVSDWDSYIYSAQTDRTANTILAAPSGSNGKASFRKLVAADLPSHSHDDRYYTETEINTKLNGKSNTGHKHVKADITDFPTSMPASDVSAWAKAATKPSYSKAEVGLGNVDNTADSTKKVKYAASAGSADSATTAATANALKVTELTTQNLDDTKTVGLYFAGGGNSVKNKPTGIDAFGLEVKKTATGYLVQVLTEGNANPMKTWIRQFNASAWSAWAHYFDSNHTPTWSQVSGKPSFATVATSGSYNDLSNKPTIPTIPGSLKNPNALTISLNGTSQGAYDGSAAKSINITASSVGAAASTHTHKMTDVSDWDSYIYSAQTDRTANTILAAPSGSNGKASFRKLVAADLPSHSHDDRYYTESEINTKLNAKAASDVVTISSTQPNSNTCKLWIKI